ncbi:MAG: hypothetical protein GW760_08780, partial [Legionella sp.]|nr:hypothetical protein [Legionella sp.]
MIIPLIEPTSPRYIHVNPITNRVHLLVPFVGGQDISTDNTYRSTAELNAFFGGGGVSELESYKSVLEFHIFLLEAGDPRRAIKKERLAQINTYLEAVHNMRDNYQATVNAFLAKPSNLYSIKLRPRVQDPFRRVVNPVFTIKRSSHLIPSTLLSPLYNAMHEVFPTLTLGKPDPRTALVNATLSALPKNASFEDIQRVLTGSPFYLGTYANRAGQAERLSIMTQFYLAILNIHCRAQGISNKNFGEILDNNTALSQALVDAVSHALTNGDDVEQAIIMFMNAHKNTFKLSRDLSVTDKDAIQAKFEITYRTVTATRESSHMDDFMILDTEARGEHALFFTQKGLI